MSDVQGGEIQSGSVPVDEQGGKAPKHVWRLVSIWVVASIAGDLIFWFVAGPHVPPGDMTSSASGAQFDFNVLFVVGLPVIFGVWTYMAYALINWRASRWVGEGDPVRGPTARSNQRVQVAWITISTIAIIGLFIFGTVELIVPAGAGSAEGPNPVWTPTSKNILPVQVIAQQWKFTYRYPTFGGMETDNLIIPDHTTIAFHVTSLDVIHSFWAYQLGVKADANPEIDDVAYTTTDQTGSITIRCSELCGIWHGAMYDYGKVVSKSEFMKWGTSTEKALADNTKFLPPFAWTYVPDANGATGVYANTSGQAPFSPIQKYGATKSAQKLVTSPPTVTPTTTTVSTVTPSTSKLTRENGHTSA